MPKQDMSSIGDIYGSILDKVATINEEANELHNEKSRLDAKCWKGHHKKGTKLKGGLRVNNCVEDEEDSEDINKKKKNIQESEKNAIEILNKFMSRKSVFDNLYNQVIKENWGGATEDAEDIDALGLGDATPDDEMEDNFGGEEEKEVTLTLDRATAKSLLELLQAAVGEEAEPSDETETDEFGGTDELDFNQGGDEDEQGFYDEDEETEGSSNLSDKNFGKLQGRDNRVGKLKASSSKAKADVNDEDTTTNFNTTVNYGTGSNNKVGNLKQATDFFK